MKKKKLCEIVSELESGSRPKGGASIDSGTIPSLGAEHLNDSGNFNFHKIKYITKTFFNSLKTGIIKKDDILIVKDGATTGKTSFVDENFPFTKAAINEHVFRVSINKDKAYPKFVFLFLNTPDGQKQIKKDFRGATVGGISKRFVELATISIPGKYEDQIRIVILLSRAEELIAKRKESIRLLDELLKSTFFEMFGDPVRNEKGWEKEILGKVSTARLGKMRDKKYITGNYLKPYLGNSNVKWFSFDLSNLLEMDFNQKEQKRFSLKYGDLLVCEGGEIGRCAIWKDQTSDCYFQKALHRVRVDKKRLNPEFLQYLFWFYSQLNGFKKVTAQATIAHLTGEKFKTLLIPIPHLPLQTQFAHIVQKTESLISKYQTSLFELNNLCGFLSQSAFRGDLDLSGIPVEFSGKTEIDTKQETTSPTLEVKPKAKKKEVDKEQKLLAKKLKQIIKDKFRTSFIFNELLDAFTDKYPIDTNAFKSESEAQNAEFRQYETIKSIVFEWLDVKKPFLFQVFDEKRKEMVLKPAI